jgi:hypothetical protein
MPKRILIDFNMMRHKPFGSYELKIPIRRTWYTEKNVKSIFNCLKTIIINV